MRWFAAALLGAALACAQQDVPHFPNKRDEPVRLPNGKLQSEAILQADFEQSQKDAAELKKLINEFCDELDKNDKHIISVQTLKKLDEIEKRAKKIRSRMTRY